MIWNTARLIVAVLVLSLGVSMGVASAQYSAPPQQAPPSSAPAAPSTAPAAAPTAPTAPAAAPANSTAPAATGPATPYMLNQRWALVNGRPEMVLTDSNGRTLYYFARDTSTTSRCTGACLRVWPAAVEPFNWSVSPALTGRVDVIQNDRTHMLTYNGHPLYTYSKDAAPGQATGEGVAGTWHVATPGMALQ